jgi:hypothetical protein
VRLELGCRQPECAGLQGFLHKGPHGRKFIGSGGAFRGAFAHHVKTQRRVSQQHRDIDGAAAILQKVEVLGKAFITPVFAEAGFQGADAHALDLLERANQE